MSRKVNNLMYAAGPGMLGTIRTGIELTEPVDRQALEQAVAKAAEKFPYFAVKMVLKGSEYLFEPNDRPFVISPEGRCVTLGSEESNEHMFAFAYDGNRIYVDTSHYITDGVGKFPFIKTVLYYYLSALHPDEAFDTQTVAPVGSGAPEVPAEDDPYPPELLPENPVGGNGRPEKAFMLPDQPQGYEHADEWTSFVFSISQKDMMAYASSLDGSPATFIASLMYKAITECHPGNRLPVVCGMQHQFRKALKKPYSPLCHVNVAPIVYPDRLRNKDVELLNTIARGSLIIRADDASDILTINRHVLNGKAIRGMTLEEKRAYMRREILDGIGENTFEVSYTGRVPWSGLDKYIRNVMPYFDMTLSGGLSIEIFSVRDVFSVNIMQRNNDRQYVDRFAALLKEFGIPYEEYEPERFGVCGFQVPENESSSDKTRSACFGGR